jgi:hypothetical protein
MWLEKNFKNKIDKITNDEVFQREKEERYFSKLKKKLTPLMDKAYNEA